MRVGPWSLLLVSLLAVVLVGTLALAGTVVGQEGNVYTGCLKGGIITKIAIGQQPRTPCQPGEIQVSWNEAGQTGGISGHTVVQADSAVDDANTVKVAFAQCPAGTGVLSGGWRISTGSQAGVQWVIADRPFVAGTTSGWSAAVEWDVLTDPTMVTWGISVYAVCVDVS